MNLTEHKNNARVEVLLKLYAERDDVLRRVAAQEKEVTTHLCPAQPGATVLVTGPQHRGKKMNVTDVTIGAVNVKNKTVSMTVKGIILKADGSLSERATARNHEKVKF